MLILKNEGITNKKLNFGIQILRMILCFWVLSFHCLEKKYINYFLYFITKTKFFHVPCFSFISFYFSNNTFFERNIIKFKKRLERLLIPYVVWPLLIAIINNYSNHKNKISFKQLKMQILLGREFMIPLWYLFSSIILTIIFFILSNLFKSHFLTLIQLLGLISYIFQYSNLYRLLYEYNTNIKNPLLDTISILPLTITGLTFGSSKIVDKFKKKRIKAIFLCYIFIYFLFKYNIFIDLGGYKGFIHIFASSFFFVGFYLLPLENVYFFIKKLIQLITSYTNGIYCLQIEIIHILKIKFNLIGNLKLAFIIYLISYFLSFIGMKICGKTKLKYLFI